MNNSNTSSPRSMSVAASKAAETDGSCLDWHAVLAGGTFALAISFILIGFGGNLGLSMVSPYRGEGMSAAWLAMAAGLCLVRMIVSSFAVGGYLYGRMRRRAGDVTAMPVTIAVLQ